MTDRSAPEVPKAARDARIGAGCLTLFALPFVAVGVFAAVQLLRGLLGDGEAGMPPGFAAVFALGFGGAGLAIIGMARFGSRRVTAETRRRAEHPDAPWLWREDWADGIARSEQRAGAIAIAVFAFLWNVISAPVLFIVPQEVADGNTPALFGLLFPVVGLGLIIWAVRLAVRSRKFRGTNVELGAVPIAPGAPFEGVLHARFDYAPEKLLLRLSCIHRYVTGSGKNRSTTERVVWQDERTLEGWDIAVDFGSARVPFTFDIPAAAPTTTAGTGDDRILWRLDAQAETPGVDYAESFELPVFGEVVGTEDRIDREAMRQLASELVVESGSVPEAPERPTIHIRSADPVGTEFFSPPGRKRVPVLPILIFGVIWWGSIVFMVRVGAPVLFPVVFGFFGILIGAFALDLLFGTTRTIVTGEGVTVHTEVLGRGKTTHVPRDAVQLVAVKVGMSQSQSATQSARAWHDVEIRWGDSRKVTAARQIPTRAEAEWVAAEMRRVIGVPTRSRHSDSPSHRPAT